jgi:SNF2 family DNA or RNA helicase
MFVGTLFPYQEEAVEKMVTRGQMLLGMVMGAGKTPTTIAAVEELFEQGEIDRCLVIVPASLKYQWRREISKFSNANAIVIDGHVGQRSKLWRVSRDYRYVIVNPESLANDEKLVGDYQCVVVDEATTIKTRSAKRSRLVKRIGRKVAYRFALTGQPIENRPEELFSIMEFVDKEVLGDFKTFDRTFIVRDHWGKPIRYRNLDVMTSRMQDCMVRKTREDIKDQLPKIVHQVIPVPFDTKGAIAYRRISSDLLAHIQSAVKSGRGGFNLWQHYNGGDGDEAQGQIMSRLTVLRMLCDNPELVKESARSYGDNTTKVGSQYAHEIVQNGWMTGVEAAPKLVTCVEYIQEVLDEHPDNKVVLFSFFKKNLRMIKEATKDITDSVLFMGGMTAEEKDVAKNKFANESGTRLFLSSDAGGYGVDLPMANYLISYDLPWSSGKLEQREARIIRLSSQFDHVTIATLVMQGSIEERQYDMLQHKRSVNEAFIDGKHHDSSSGLEVTLDTLSEFLNSASV